MAGLSLGGLVLNILIYFVSSEGDRFGLIPDFVMTHLNNLYLLKNVKTDDLGLCCCLEMTQRDLPSLCSSTVLILN